MKKILFILLGVGAFAASSCDWWDPRGPWDPVDPPNDTIYDPWEPPGDTIKDPWDPPRDTGNGGGPGDTIIIIDPWDPMDSNWFDPRDTN